MNQADKVAQFRALHESPRAWIMPNPWDGASCTNPCGSRLQGVGDVQRRYRRNPRSTGSPAVARRRAGSLPHDRCRHGPAPWPRIWRTALVTARIRWPRPSGLPRRPVWLAVHRRLDRSRRLAAVQPREAGGAHLPRRWTQARATPCGFMLTARAENYLHGKADLEDTIRRLQAFERAGADVLFAPGLPDLDTVRAVCAAVSKPVNFMIGISGKSFSVAALEACGVRRISLAASLYRQRWRVSSPRCARSGRRAPSNTWTRH